VGQLLLSQIEEEIGLILKMIWGAPQKESSPPRIITNLGIMPRGNEIRTPSPGSPKQRAKLQQRIAVKTGIRGFALEVALDKIRDNRLREFAFYVDYIEGNLQLVGNLSSIFNRPG
jgi:hypothetical protein